MTHVFRKSENSIEDLNQ